MWSAGQNYSQRIYQLEDSNITAQELIQSVRNEITQLKIRENDKKFAKNRAKQLLNGFTKKQFLSDFKIQDEVKNFISVVHQKQKAYKVFQSSTPVIYGLEYRASTSKLSNIRDDYMVKIGHIKSEDIAFGEKLRQGLQPKLGKKQSYDGIKPKKYQVYGHAKNFIHADDHTLWEILNNIQQTGKVNENF